MSKRVPILLALVLLAALPLAGGAWRGFPEGFFAFPPLVTQPPDHAPFAWPVFAVVAAIALLAAGILILPTIVAGAAFLIWYQLAYSHSALTWVPLLIAALALVAVLVLAHAGAAIFHHLFQGDATLARMLPRGWLRAPSEESPDA